MSNFNQSLDYLLSNEGGWSNRAADRGGPTMLGVTLKTYSEYLGREATVEELQLLNKETVAPIYYHLFWSRLRLSFVNNNNFATAILDTGANEGVMTASLITQKTLCSLLLDVDIDGVIGPRTCEMLDKADQNKFIAAFEKEVEDHYNAIVAHDPKEAVNLHGWLNRATKLLTLR